jgi:hypothetical protein
MALFSAAVQFPIGLRLNKNRHVMAKLYCAHGPQLTLELKGEQSRLTESEFKLVNHIEQEMREFQHR